MAGVAHQAYDGGNIDDALLALLHEHTGEGLAQRKRTLEVRGDGIPCLLTHSHEQVIACHSGIVDEDVYPVRLLDNGRVLS